jgi:hypothetical protein
MIHEANTPMEVEKKKIDNLNLIDESVDLI